MYLFRHGVDVRGQRYRGGCKRSRSVMSRQLGSQRHRSFSREDASLLRTRRPASDFYKSSSGSMPALRGHIEHNASESNALGLTRRRRRRRSLGRVFRNIWQKKQLVCAERNSCSGSGLGIFVKSGLQETRLKDETEAAEGFQRLTGF